MFKHGVCGLKQNVSEDGNEPSCGKQRTGALKSIHHTEAVIDSPYHIATCPESILHFCSNCLFASSCYFVRDSKTTT